REGFTPDGRRVLVASPGGLHVHPVAEVSDPRAARVLALPAEHRSLVPLSDRAVAALHGSRVTVVPLDGAPTSSFEVPAPSVQDQLYVRPGHPGQVAVRNAAGVELRDARDGRRVGRVPAAGPSTAVFDQAGARLAVTTSAGEVEVWDVARGTRSWSFPGGGVEPVGFRDDTLVVGAVNGVQLWRDARLVGQFDHDGTKSGHYRVVGDRLHHVSFGGQDEWVVLRDFRSLPLDPAGEVRRLCALQDRDFTAVEAAALPVGAVRDRPCAR
ncbi:hypothetical protein ACFV4N_25020, partial [Actinosynnema sp. NPDC059797]